MSAKLRVVVANPLAEELCQLIEQLEPRLAVIRDQALLPSQRFPSDYQGDPSFTRTEEQQARFEALIDSADVLYGIPDVQPAELARTVRANPRLRWVQLMAAGGGAQVKAAGLDAAELDRVVFTTGSGPHAEPLAEFALFGLLAGAKQLPRLTADKAAKLWPQRWLMNQVAGQTVVVAGLGSIGQACAAKCTALGARVVGIKLKPTPIPGVDAVYPPTEIVQAARGADALINTLPGTEATAGLIDAAVLAALRPGATIVSVGRGTVFNEADLIAALDSGQVGFAALDVFAVEPLPPDSPLWDLPNVVISPHTATTTAYEERLMAESFARNATRFLDGQPLVHQVDTVHFF